MRTERINHSKHGSDTLPEIRLQPGQIVRGKVLQLFPLDRARIQLGAYQFIAQLEASLEHGERYFFQVADVKDEIHLRVIQQTHVQEGDEWQHILQYLGNKHTKVREQFVRELLQSNIPFTKNSLQQVFTLIDNHPNQAHAMDALQLMMQRAWPLSREIMESIIVYQSSTFTKEVRQLYQSLSQSDQEIQTNRPLMQRLEWLLPEIARANETLRPLFDRITTNEAKNELQLLQWIHPQMNKENIQKLIHMPVAERIRAIPTPSQMLEYIGIRTPQEQQVFRQTLASIATNAPVFQQQVEQFLQAFQRNIQLKAIHQSNNTIDAETYLRMQESFMNILPTEQWTTSDKTLMRQVLPTNVHALLQMMIDVKGVNVETLKQIIPHVHNVEQTTENKQISREFMRALQHVKQHIGLSYEHSVAQEKMGQLENSLKGLLMEFIQHEGIGAERAKPLLQFIQGMQLHTVQETAHMLSVHLQIPAMIGTLRSDMHIELESKKTSSHTIDADYCRILFDLDLAALKRTLIDMYVQNQQVSFIIYNDFPFIKKIAESFEPTLKENLRNTGYEVTSIRYQPLNKTEDKQNNFAKSFKATEGFDIKI